jgi:predicted SprT family Zn-dependent metalloprotease
MNTSELIAKVLAEAELIWEQFSFTYNCGPIPEIEFTTRKSNYAGKAYLFSQKVEFNLRYAEEPSFMDTVAHELAHIIQFRLFPRAKQAHGPEFRAILDSIGSDSSTYHRYNVTTAKSKKLDKIAAYDLISPDEM